MRLTGLRLKNFGPYAESEIDLSGVSAAIVCGENGAGKSTGFIDAPLWALFGQCRAEMDEVMRLGTDEMVVEVRFNLNGQTYRVIRRRSVKTKAGKSDLELQILQSGTEPLHGEAVSQWVSISGARIAQTQEKICDLLNADYHLVTSTSFLVQGQADRFTKATSGERKSLLAQILRLDLYPRLKQAANTAAVRVHDAIEAKRDELTIAEDRAKALPKLQEDQAGADKEQTYAEARQRVCEREIGEAREAVTSLRGQMAAAQEQRKRLGQLNVDIGLVQNSLKAIDEKRGRVSKILEKRDLIAEKAKELVEAETHLVETSGGLLSLDEQVRQGLAALEEIRTKLDGARLQERHVIERQAQVDRLVAAYEMETTRLRREYEQHEKSAKLLTMVPCGSDLQAQCQFTIQAVKAKESLESQRTALSARFTEPEQMAESAVRALKEAQALLVQCGIEALQKREQERKDNQAMLVTTQRDVQDRVKAIRAHIDDLRKYTAIQPEIDAADATLADLAEQEQQTTTRLTALTTELSEVNRQVEAAGELEGKLRMAEQAVTGLERTRTDLVSRLMDLSKHIGSLKAQIEQAQEAARIVEQAEPEMQALRDRHRLLEWLAEAYATIPVLIMETAIPLIEQHTNALLGRISKKGLTVRLDTQKALKSRDGLAETLDIVVRDVFGERRYELYSGGEKYRLDLALRVGLSKMLANRAGAKLETLIIDEGLGSLDDDGRAQLRECLGILQDEFPLILLITHIEDMKYTFPTRLVVSNPGSGSVIEVVD